MTKRRKVGNLLALAVLSTVITRPMHPYEMATIMRQRGKERDMQIKWGSLYTVVQNLEKHGFLRATQSERHGGRPERTVYEITDAGRAELLDWVRELVGVAEPEVPRFESGLSVLAALMPNEAIELLKQRLRAMDEQNAAARAELAAAAARIPRLFLVEAEYDLTIRSAEAEWVRSLLRDFNDGPLRSELDGWRAWHSTGEAPAEWADLEGGQTEQR